MPLPLGVAMSTCLHELPQEMADYASLTGSAVSSSRPDADPPIFVPGSSVVHGVAIVNLVPVGQPTSGLMLAFGEEVYVHLASVACTPQVALLANRRPRTSRASLPSRWGQSSSE